MVIGGGEGRHDSRGNGLSDVASRISRREERLGFSTTVEPELSNKVTVCYASVLPCERESTCSG